MKTSLKSIVLAAVATMALAGAAVASSCPTHVKAIDAAMSTSSASAEQKAQAKSLRDEGEALHKAGKHDASMAKLAEARKLLGI